MTIRTFNFILSKTDKRPTANIFFTIFKHLLFRRGYHHIFNMISGEAEVLQRESWQVFQSIEASTICHL